MKHVQVWENLLESNEPASKTVSKPNVRVTELHVHLVECWMGLAVQVARIDVRNWLDHIDFAYIVHPVVQRGPISLSVFGARLPQSAVAARFWADRSQRSGFAC